METLRGALVMPLLFGVLAAGAGWAARLFVDGGAPTAAGGTPGMLVWILAPVILSLLFRRVDPVVRDAHVFRTTGRTIRIAAMTGALAAGAVGVVIAAGLAARTLSFTAAGMSPATLVATAASVALFAFLEELAWRGYLLPSLLPRARYPVVIGIGSSIWFAWHLPYLERLTAAFTTESATTLAPRLLLGLIALQFLYTELFLRCRSIWPAFALHATTNVVAQLALVSGLTLAGPWPWLLSPSADGALLAALSGAIALALYRQRLTPSKRTSEGLDR